MVQSASVSDSTVLPSIVRTARSIVQNMAVSDRAARRPDEADRGDREVEVPQTELGGRRRTRLQVAVVE
jgi:hypothetical protein